MTALQFFATLYAGQTGILELRTFGPEESDQSPKAIHQRRMAYQLRSFVPVQDGVFPATPIERFLSGCEQAELGAFFGVALRTPESIQNRKGDAAHCHWLTAFYVDSDFKHLSEAEIRTRLAAFPIQPSITVHSGNGLHLYWRLKMSLDLQRNYPGAQSLLRRLAYSVAGIADVDVSEPTRVLRIPGSLNFKYSPARLVTVERLTNLCIDPSMLPLVEMATPHPSGSPSGMPLQVPDTVLVTQRHATMRDLMRSMQARGVPLEGALAACHVENVKKCQPPLARADLDAYLRRVAQLPDRPGFTRTVQTGWELVGSLIDIGMSKDAVLVAVRSITPGFDPELGVRG